MKNTRDYLFDNYKAMLIVLVVIGHFIQPCHENNLLLYTIKYVIYAFHMPAFIFISGYFSKKDIPWKKAVQKLLIPYFVFHFMYYFYYTCFLGLDLPLNVAVPKFTLWYLLALFAWRVITPYFRKVPHGFLVSIGLGLAFGLIPISMVALSISRIFVLYPYFLAGLYLDRNKLVELRNKRNRVIGIAGIIAFTVFCATGAKAVGFKVNYFYGKSSYLDMGQGAIDGILVRLLCYGIGFFFIYAIAILMTEKQTRFTKLSSASMAIYLFHGLLYKFFEHKTTILEKVDTIPESIMLLMFCVGLTYLFSRKVFCKFTDVFMNINIKRW